MPFEQKGFELPDEPMSSQNSTRADSALKKRKKRVQVQPSSLKIENGEINQVEEMPPLE